MNAHPKFIAHTAHVDDAAVQPLPRSRKVYAAGSRADIQVPMREISQTDTPAAFGAEANPPVYVYDTSGPYTDPAARIDIRAGLAPLRAKWIEERGDTKLLAGPTSRTDSPAHPRWGKSSRPAASSARSRLREGRGMAITIQSYNNAVKA